MTRRDGRASKVVRVRALTALGGFLIEATDRGLRAVTPIATGTSERVADDARRGPTPGDNDAASHAQAAADALRRYALGENARYQGPLDLAAPAFHLAVWGRLRAIPFGATTTYGEIATALGMPGEARAVGAAVGANPFCILVPCHRVVAADGSLRGFAWGLELKRRLLAHEGSGALSLFDVTRR
jgi:O-6-methylguanine DNA methyltransferase